MNQATFQILPLREVAGQLPADCWIVERLSDTERFDGELALRVQGDLNLRELDLDDPLKHGGELRVLIGASDDVPTSIFLLLIEGTLQVETCILNENTDGATNLVVLGSVTAHDMAIGGQYVYVRDGLTARNLLWGDYNHGSLRVDGATVARVGVFSDEYTVELSGDEQFIHLLDEVRDVPSLIEFSSESVVGVFESAVLQKTGNGNVSVTTLLDRDALIAALRAGESVTRSDDAIAAFMPTANDVFADEALSIQNVMACVRSGVIEEDAVHALGWFAQTEFVIGKRRIDEDGDQRDDRVFITVWKTYDFYIGVAHQPAEAAQGLGSKLKSVLRNRPAPANEVLEIQYRSYTDGEPNAWETFDDDADEVARNAAIKAWRGVLDYVRKAIGQIRAGYPLARRVQAELTYPRVMALIALPVFVEEHNDWWGDQGGESGFWHEDTWIAARQTCEHDGEHFTRTFKFGWENGEDQAGDEENNAYAFYFLEETEQAGQAPSLTFQYKQRENDGRVNIPPVAADHYARLLRCYTNIEPELLEVERKKQSARLERQRIVNSVSLLQAPPYAETVRDRAIFPRDLMTLSEQWQAQGRSFVEGIREIHARYEANPDDMPDDDDEEAWPNDAREETWPTVLQLARVVSSHADSDLAARFRRLFSFAPSAMNNGAAKHGQFIGPLFVLGDGRVVTRVGANYDEQSYWTLLDGVRHTHLSDLQGLGRSPNRQCFASCEADVLITRNGFQGPEIARFPLPSGVEGLPEALNLAPSASGRRCDVLIPFNDGKRVLVLNPTGIYSVDQHGVQRLHPQIFDEDGPYTWPKNQGDNDLELAMLHMALSPDERFIMLGDQDSEHVLLRADGSYVRGLDPTASYPHHAVFSHNGMQVMANSCHLYAGYTSITRVDSDEEPRDFELSWRVYASVAAPEFVILGNAEGYIHAVDYSGKIVWRHHIGSSISAIDISEDGNTVIAASYGGYLARLEKTTGEPDPFSTGTSPFTETSRWLFWKEEATPIHW